MGYSLKIGYSSKIFYFLIIVSFYKLFLRNRDIGNFQEIGYFWVLRQEVLFLHSRGCYFWKIGYFWEIACFWELAIFEWGWGNLSNNKEFHGIPKIILFWKFMIKICYIPPFPLPADFKFKQALAKYHQMIIDIYVMEPIHYLRILSIPPTNVLMQVIQLKK